MYDGLRKPFQPNWQGLVNNILRKGTPDRVYFAELFHDGEIADALVKRFELDKGFSKDAPDYWRRRYIATQRFAGLDYVTVNLVGQEWKFFNESTADTTATQDTRRQGGRMYQDEHRGPIMSWEDFEKYPWPDPNKPEATREYEAYTRDLPQDMCIIGGLTAHFHEYITWLMGYETLCYALYDQRDLVKAIYDKLESYFLTFTRRMLQFDRVKMIWASDDMGFRGGLLISPNDTREFVLKGHKKIAAMCHAAGRPYLLHACGNLADIIPDLVHDVKIDAKHSFEDTIEDVRQVKQTYGRDIAMLGGVDVDFLCRSDEQAIRRRVRDTLDKCMPGGGYCLGTGNTVANYIPLDNYLAMVDEGRLWGS